MAVILTQMDGTDVTARLYKDGAFAAALDAISGGTLDGLKKLVKDSTGRYYAFYKCTSADTEECLNYQIKYEEGAVLMNADRSSTIVEELGDAVAKEATLTTIDGLIDAIKAITDALPDSGALSSLAQDSTVAKSSEISTLDGVIDAGFSAGAKSSEISTLDGVIDAGFLAGAKEASLAALATSAEIATLDGVVDAGFSAGAKDATVAKSSEISTLDGVIDAGFSAGAKDATVAKSSEIATLDGVIDAGFSAGAKEASLAALATASSIADLDTLIDSLNNVSTANLGDYPWDEATSGHTTAGTFGKMLADISAGTARGGLAM
jgi:hypothetical protein